MGGSWVCALIERELLTLERALLDGSPAIGGGSPKDPDGKDGACAPADQRGVKRPQAYGGDTKPACDIGAYEAQKTDIVFNAEFETGC